MLAGEMDKATLLVHTSKPPRAKPKAATAMEKDRTARSPKRLLRTWRQRAKPRQPLSPSR
jgi:hypothetical protein